MEFGQWVSLPWFCLQLGLRRCILRSVLLDRQISMGEGGHAEQLESLCPLPSLVCTPSRCPWYMLMQMMTMVAMTMPTAQKVFPKRRAIGYQYWSITFLRGVSGD